MALEKAGAAARDLTARSAAGRLADGTVVVGEPTPLLSWRRTAATGSRVPATELQLEQAHLRLTVTVPSDQGTVEWPFPPIAPGATVTLRARALDGGGFSAWSAPLRLIHAGLAEEDWEAAWVSTGRGPEDPAPEFVRTFDVVTTPDRALLRITALGVISIRVNGQRITEDLFVPGWTSYDRLIRYRMYDVGPLLRTGRNEIAVTVGEGWYRGRVASLPVHRGEPYGDDLALLAQLQLVDSEAVTATIATDASWRWRPSHVLTNDFYDGQTTNLRRTEVRPTRPVVVMDRQRGPLRPAAMAAVRPQAPIAPIDVWDSAAGRIVDFGRNLAGWVRLTVDCDVPSVITVRHAEVLTDRELELRPLRSARAEDVYLLPAGRSTVEPEFTYHGFRYAEIAIEGQVAQIAAEAVPVGTELIRTATFECSHAGLNALHDNAVRSARANFVDIPTDCPQRDERLGWTGDIQVFAAAASRLFDVHDFLRSWLESLRLDQLPDGTVPAVVPRVFRAEHAFAGWSDASVIVPWVLYRHYGDPTILREQFDSMRRWVDRAAAGADPDRVWREMPQLGDWLDPSAPPDDPSAVRADPAVVATAYLAHSAGIVADAAEVLHEAGDATYYRQLSAMTRRAFNDAFVREDGFIVSDCQTVYALAITFGLIEGDTPREGAGRRLIELVESADFAIDTGFLGTSVLLDALVTAGSPSAAMRVLTHTDRPSWLYAVEMGATSIWERWDSLLPDGSINPGTMTSFNHYAFGAVVDWMHREIGGLHLVEPGFRRVRIAPRGHGQVTSASLCQDTPFGQIRIDWQITDKLEVRMEIPLGVTADIELPNTLAATVGHGVFHWSTPLEPDAQMGPTS